MLNSATQNERSGRSRWIGVAIGLAICLLLINAWGKFDFCYGWARHYEDLASQHRMDASNPDLQAESVHEYLIVAEWDEIIARKYKMAAMQPWPFGSYPKAPLVSTHEKVSVLQKLAKNGRIPQDAAKALEMNLLHSR